MEFAHYKFLHYYFMLMQNLKLIPLTCFITMLSGTFFLAISTIFELCFSSGQTFFLEVAPIATKILLIFYLKTALELRMITLDLRDNTVNPLVSGHPWELKQSVR